MKTQKHSSRRSFIKKAGLATGLGLSAGSWSLASNLQYKNTEDIVGHGDFRYKVDKKWGTQDPRKIPVKDCHEMVQDSKGRLILLTNHTKNNVIIYDKSGKVIKTWTLDLPGAHGLTISQEGDEEFLFITDTDLHQVYKTDLKGKVIFKLDYPKEGKAYDKADDFKPTEVAVAPNGDFYVADGYGKNYITQYDSKGNYIKHFGGQGQGDDQFDCCHGVTLDTRNPDSPTLLITSRSKQEFKRFSLDGKRLETIKMPGCWICRPVIKGKYLYFAVLVTKTWGTYDGMIAVLDENNKVISFPGGSKPVYENGILQQPDYDDLTFLNPHDVCVDDEENLYIPTMVFWQNLPGKTKQSLNSISN